MTEDKQPVAADEEEAPSAPQLPSQEQEQEPEKPGRLKQLWHAYLAKKKLTIPVTLLVFLGLIMALPWTRYQVLGLFVSKNFSVTVLDSETNRPVSEADVTLRGKTAKTDGRGRATIRDIEPGNTELTVTKKYYRDASAQVLVALEDSRNSREIKLNATGRQVAIMVANKITGEGLEGVKISVLDTEAETDENGEATVVLPADKTSEAAMFRLDGYNEATVELEVSSRADFKNEVALTPSGKVYFLSKQSGTIDVIKTNLDGSQRETVLKGTGSEADDDTILLASRDWKYLALKSRREGDAARLYLIETATDNVSIIDEGAASFTLAGWHNERFIYLVDRGKNRWEPKNQALKSYNADTKQLTTLDETAAEGDSPSNYAQQDIAYPYILDNTIVYTKSWLLTYGFPASGKAIEIVSIRPDGNNRQSLKRFPIEDLDYSYITAKSYAIDEIYFRLFENRTTSYFEYENGTVKEAEGATDQTFNSFYPTFLLSPSGKRTFWYEPRDGKNTLLLGNATGDEPEEIARLSELTPYGWFTDDYLLASKDGSELYIMASAKDSEPLKVTDYHKPNFDSRGYGYGYGGF